MITEENSIGLFLQDFRETIETGASRLKEISPEQSRRETGPGKWTAKEILGHLIDSAANNHQRFVRAQFTDDLVFAGYEQDDWVVAQRYNDESWSELVQLWMSYNLHLIHLVSVIPTSVLTRLRTQHSLDQIAWSTVEKTQPTTLEYFVRDYLAHLRHHLAQLFGESKPVA